MDVPAADQRGAVAGGHRGVAGGDLAVFGRGTRGIAVDVAVADTAVVRWLGGIDLPGFQGLRGLAALSSWWVLNVASHGLVIALLVFRRFRQLIMWLILANLLSAIGGRILGPVAQRPRPFGVVIREGWGLGDGAAAPHLLRRRAGDRPLHDGREGRWRNSGKWVVTALLGLNGVGRIGLGADAPTDVLVGVALG
jgi:hypothetical protein